MAASPPLCLEPPAPSREQLPRNPVPWVTGTFLLVAVHFLAAAEPAARQELMTNSPPLQSAANPTAAAAACDAADTVATNALTARERFVRFATTRRFPRFEYTTDQQLRASTLGLRVEEQDGRWIVTTPLGLGLSEAQAKGWLTPLADSVVERFDRFEFNYRVALVPAELGGPGLTFGEAQQLALKLALAGRAFPEFVASSATNGLGQFSERLRRGAAFPANANSNFGPPFFPYSYSIWDYVYNFQSRPGVPFQVYEPRLPAPPDLRSLPITLPPGLQKP